MAIIPDVVAQQVIQSSWGNGVRDTGISRFATLAERNSQLATPPDGRTCFVIDVNQMYVGVDGSWRTVLHDGAGVGGGAVGSVTILALPVTSPQGGKITYAGSPAWVTEVYSGQLHLYTGTRAAAQIQIASSAITLRGNVTVAGALTTSGRITTTGGIRVDGGTLDVNVASTLTTVSATAITASSLNLGSGNLTAGPIVATSLNIGGTIFDTGLVSAATSLSLRLGGSNYLTVESGTTDLLRIRESGGKADINVPRDLPMLTGGHLVIITNGSNQLGRSAAHAVPLGGFAAATDLEALALDVAELREELVALKVLEPAVEAPA